MNFPIVNKIWCFAWDTVFFSYFSAKHTSNMMRLVFKKIMILSIVAISVFVLGFNNRINADKEDTDNLISENRIRTGADQTEKYVAYLKGKRVAIMANPTTIIGKKHLVDSLQALGINIVKVFGPEHGFRGNASAGVKVGDEMDQATGIPIISLYGPKNKPTKEDMANIDVLIYDLQDVGVRFYTNINALARLMEACTEN